MSETNLTAAAVMTAVPVVIAPDAPLAQAIRLMAGHRISGLPVVNAAGEAVGMLTEGDLLRRQEIGSEGGPPGWFESLFMPGRSAAHYVQTHGRRVQDVMTPEVVSVTEFTPVADIAALMIRHRIKRLPVLRDNKVVGIVSRADLVRAIGDKLDVAQGSADDATIRRLILNTMESQSWLQRSVTLAVENGIVLFDGCVFDPRQRDALTVIAENTPGVKEVQNRLVCIEPNSGMVIYDPNEDPEAPRTT